jgi:ABC-2 type transport system permease protein
MKTLTWLIRREFWENRAIWMLPLAIGGLLIVAALFGRVDLSILPTRTRPEAVGGMVLFAFGAIFFLVMSLYSTWYLLDCLYADRKDHSILFWKSLPISDAQTVLSKLCTALIVIPVVYFLAADLTTLLMAFIVSIRSNALLGSAQWRLDLWQPAAWIQLQVLWIYLIVTIAVWYLPLAGWLMLVSAWARRAVMLWSLLPPLVLILAERWFIGSTVIGTQLLDRLWGFMPRAFHDPTGSLFPLQSLSGEGHSKAPDSVWSAIDATGFFSDPATLIGAAVGVALIFCVIQLRLRRTEL